MPFLQTPLGRLHFELKGASDPQAPLMVLLHAVGLCAGWWADYARQYRGGWRIAALDLPGHGLSSPPADGMQLHDIAGQVAELVDLLGGPAHVVGVSMGGMVAQELAIRHPGSVASLVLLSTVSSVAEEVRRAMAARGALALASGMEAAARETALRWGPEGVESREFRDRCFDQLRINDPASWAACWNAISQIDTWARLPQVDCPVLVGTGELDTSTTPDHGRTLAARVADGWFIPLAAAGHMAAFSRPAAAQAAMDRFYAHVAATQQ